MNKIGSKVGYYYYFYQIKSIIYAYIWEYYKQLCAKNWINLNEMDNFLKHSLTYE